MSTRDPPGTVDCHECGADLGRPGLEIIAVGGVHTPTERARFRCGVCQQLKCESHAGRNLSCSPGGSWAVLCCQQCIDAGAKLSVTPAPYLDLSKTTRRT